MEDAPKENKSTAHRIWMIVAEIALILTVIGLLVAIWLPIEGFRHWLAKFFPGLGS